MRKNQAGFIQNLIIPSLILAGIVLAGWSMMANKNQTGVNIGRSVDESRATLTVAQNALNWCRAVYPAGNNGESFAVGSEHHTILPGSGGAWVPLRNIKCPGDTSQTLWSASHTFLPLPGMYLAEWEYKNDDTGIYLRISTASAGDPYGRAVLSQIASRIHPEQRMTANGGDALDVVHMR